VPAATDHRSRADVVVVGHDSRETLRSCVEPLAGAEGVRIVVVDTASPDDAFDTVADLPSVATVAAPRNGGFSYGCNLGAALGSAPLVLFLNPDASLRPIDLDALVAVLDADADAGVAAPRIVGSDGSTEPSQRRFPRIRAQLATALFVHRLAPHASWSDDLIRDPAAYERPGSPDWVSGACMLVRRDVFTRLGGFDEGFFLYSEDIDLCRRVRDVGLDVRYVPAARATHAGGHSAPRSSLRVVDVRSRVRYELVHGGAGRARAMALAVALSEFTHLIVRLPRRGYARGHLSGLAAALSAAAAPRRAARLAATAPWAEPDGAT